MAAVLPRKKCYACSIKLKLHRSEAPVNRGNASQLRAQALARLKQREAKRQGQAWSPRTAEAGSIKAADGIHHERSASRGQLAPLSPPIAREPSVPAVGWSPRQVKEPSEAVPGTEEEEVASEQASAQEEEVVQAEAEDTSRQARRASHALLRPKRRLMKETSQIVRSDRAATAVQTDSQATVPIERRATELSAAMFMPAGDASLIFRPAALLPKRNSVRRSGSSKAWPQLAADEVVVLPEAVTPAAAAKALMAEVKQQQEQAVAAEAAIAARAHHLIAEIQQIAQLAQVCCVLPKYSAFAHRPIHHNAPASKPDGIHVISCSSKAASRRKRRPCS